MYMYFSSSPTSSSYLMGIHFCGPIGKSSIMKLRKHHRSSPHKQLVHFVDVTPSSYLSPATVMRVFVAIAALCCAASVAARAPRDKPNIVMLFVDDLGYANVGFHNDEPITPEIDRLASDGLVLDRFYTLVGQSFAR